MHAIKLGGMAAATFVLAGTVASSALAAEWSDTYLGYRYGDKFREPNNPNDVKKDIVQFQTS